MCLFRFKLWWMTQRMGSCGQDIPFETQFLIVEAREGSHSVEDDGDKSPLYVVFLPILEGDFRAVLQGNERNEIEICLESGTCVRDHMSYLYIFIFIYVYMYHQWRIFTYAGDPSVTEFDGSHLVFMAAGRDPFDVITNAVK